ncbi:MAG: hypothetical protein AAGA90_09190 [Actinomycetota bacterium]
MSSRVWGRIGVWLIGLAIVVFVVHLGVGLEDSRNDDPAFAWDRWFVGLAPIGTLLGVGVLLLGRPVADDPSTEG